MLHENGQRNTYAIPPPKIAISPLGPTSFETSAGRLNIPAPTMVVKSIIAT